MLGADVVVAQAQRLAQGQLEHLLGAGREGDVTGGGLVALADDVAHLLARGLEGHPEGLEGLGADALVLMDETQEDVLGADVVVVQQARLVLSQDDDAAGAIGEAFEHVTPMLVVVDASSLRGARGRQESCSPRA